MDIFDAYDQIKSIGKSSVVHLRNGNVDKLGQAMDDHWNIKQRMTKKISNSAINSMYLELKSFGSLGGKVVGAGGGGYFLFYVTPKNKFHLLQALQKRGLTTLPFNFDELGLQSWQTRNDKAEN